MLKYLKLGVILSVFILVLIPSLHIPMHSDDYTYSLKGNSLSDHIHHYLSWSGRFVTDYISTTLLSLNYKLREVINSIAFVALVFFISSIPAVIINKNESILKAFNPFTFLIIFFLYWIGNPNLGQTSFWIIGSANYMWTNLFIVCFYFFLFYFINNITISNYKKIFLVFLSIIAGCSNENTGIIVVLITFCIYCIFLKHRKIILFSLLGNLIGYLILILAPGNSERAKHLSSWYSMSIFKRIYIHMFERIPTYLNGYWMVFIVIIMSLLIYILVEKKLSKNYRIFILIFFVGSMLSGIILVASPWVPIRVGNGTLSFLLLSCSMIIYVLDLSKHIILRVYKYFLLFISVFLFVPSYVLFCRAIFYTEKQAEIRNSIILEAKKNHKTAAYIPSFYFTKLIKETDKFDLYFDGYPMGNYFGMNEICEYNVDFNYVELYEAKEINVNINLRENLSLNKILWYKNFDKIDVFLQFNRSLMEDELLDITMYNKNDKEVEYIYMSDKVMYYENYYYKMIKYGINENDIKKLDINIRVYDKEKMNYIDGDIYEIEGKRFQ